MMCLQVLNTITRSCTLWNATTIYCGDASSSVISESPRIPHLLPLLSNSSYDMASLAAVICMCLSQRVSHEVSSLAHWHHIPTSTVLHVNLISCRLTPAGKFSGTVAPNWALSLSEGLKVDGAVHTEHQRLSSCRNEDWHHLRFIALHG